MTNSQPDRLDRITDKLDRITNVLDIVTETAIKNENNIAALTLKTEEHDRLIDGLITAARDNAIAAERNNQTIAVLAEKVDRVIERIDTMQSEIRGLQTENRRILDRLLGEETDEN
jgi:ribosomal protein L17